MTDIAVIEPENLQYLVAEHSITMRQFEDAVNPVEYLFATLSRACLNFESEAMGRPVRDVMITIRVGGLVG